MKKLLTEHYPLTMGILWLTSLPMVVKDAFGFIPSLCAAIVAVGIGASIVKTTTHKSLRVKALSLFASVLSICMLVGLFVKREAQPVYKNDIETDALSE